MTVILGSDEDYRNRRPLGMGGPVQPVATKASGFTGVDARSEPKAAKHPPVDTGCALSETCAACRVDVCPDVAFSDPRERRTFRTSYLLVRAIKRGATIREAAAAAGVRYEHACFLLRTRLIPAGLVPAAIYPKMGSPKGTHYRLDPVTRKRVRV